MIIIESVGLCNGFPSLIVKFTIDYKQNEIICMEKHRLIKCRECSGSVVECLTRDRGAVGSNLTGVTALWDLSKNINPSLVLVQPRKTRPFITERLLMGRKESNHKQ